MFIDNDNDDGLYSTNCEITTLLPKSVLWNLFVYVFGESTVLYNRQKTREKESRYNMKTVRHQGSALTGVSSKNDKRYNLFVIDVLFIADCKDTVTSYDLVAVICHHGTAGGIVLFLLYLLSTSYCLMF